MDGLASAGRRHEMGKSRIARSVEFSEVLSYASALSKVSKLNA